MEDLDNSQLLIMLTLRHCCSEKDGRARHIVCNYDPMHT